MNPADLTPGTPVQVVTGRRIAGTSWSGRTGEVWGAFRRDEVNDWVLVKIKDGGTIIVGFAPDELDPA